MNVELAPVNPDDLKDLKERMKLIVAADEKQYHNEFSLKRFLRAFKTVDASFQVSSIGAIVRSLFLNFLILGHSENEQVESRVQCGASGRDSSDPEQRN